MGYFSPNYSPCPNPHRNLTARLPPPPPCAPFCLRSHLTAAHLTSPHHPPRRPACAAHIASLSPPHREELASAIAAATSLFPALDDLANDDAPRPLAGCNAGACDLPLPCSSSHAPNVSPFEALASECEWFASTAGLRRELSPQGSALRARLLRLVAQLAASGVSTAPDEAMLLTLYASNPPNEDSR